jgi:hypothetical protein
MPHLPLIIGVRQRNDIDLQVHRFSEIYPHVMPLKLADETLRIDLGYEIVYVRQWSLMLNMSHKVHNKRLNSSWKVNIWWIYL